MKSQMVTFQKIHRNCYENLQYNALEHSIPIQKISMAGYVTIYNGGLCNRLYWILSVPSSVPGRRAVSVIFFK